MVECLQAPLARSVNGNLHHQTFVAVLPKPTGHRRVRGEESEFVVGVWEVSSMVWVVRLAVQVCAMIVEATRSPAVAHRCSR